MNVVNRLIEYQTSFKQLQNACLPCGWPEFDSSMLKEYFLIVSSSYNYFILFILGLREEKQSCYGLGGGTQRPVLCVNDHKKTGLYCTSHGFAPQSKELVRGPPELVQHFRL